MATNASARSDSRTAGRVQFQGSASPIQSDSRPRDCSAVARTGHKSRDSTIKAALPSLESLPLRRAQDANSIHEESKILMRSRTNTKDAALPKRDSNWHRQETRLFVPQRTEKQQGPLRSPVRSAPITARNRRAQKSALRLIYGGVFLGPRHRSAREFARQRR